MAPIKHERQTINYASMATPSIKPYIHHLVNLTSFTTSDSIGPSKVLSRNKMPKDKSSNRSSKPKKAKHPYLKNQKCNAQIYSCGNCSYKSTRLFNLQTHENSCSDLQIRYQCLVCSKDFSHLSSFKNHFLTHKRTMVTTVRVVAVDAIDGKLLFK